MFRFQSSTDSGSPPNNGSHSSPVGDSRPALAGLILVVLLFAGCDPTSKPDYASLGLVEIEGRVTLDDQPLSHAEVRFEHEDRTYSYGVTDDTGHYRMMFDSMTPGVLPGEKTVRIRGQRPGLEGPEESDENGDATNVASASPASIPAEYNTRSILKVSIVGTVRDLDFALRSRPESPQ